MTEEERCKQTAQDRLRDAFALYNAERYSSALYMCGYVIELGVKAEFHKLANTELHVVKREAGAIINQLFTEEYKDRKPSWMNQFKFPTTIRELTKLICDAASLRDDTSKPTLPTPRNLKNFGLILDNKLKPAKSSEQEDDAQKSTFHDIPAFLKFLNEWKQSIGESGFDADEYGKIVTEFGWGTYLRYGEASPNNKEVEQSDSRDALEMAIKFLEEVILVDVSEFESQLSSNNISTPNNAGV